ncbi:WYL domain-containing protein [uncultured Psychrobacter sp.]|uniref:WYL domain-containing protein n=1 Tax=uncultured Psychrobacter sp. TaxID=259303 RepID=UPI00345B8CA6
MATLSNPAVTVGAKACSLTLKINAKMSYRIFEEFTQEQISKIDDNYYLVNCLTNDGEWLDSYLLSFGKYLQVLAPTIIQNRLKKELKIPLVACTVKNSIS